MVEAKLLRKKLKNGLIVDKWDLVTIIEKQQAEMDIVIKLLCGEQISDDLMTHWNPLHSTLKSKLLKAKRNEVR